MELEKAYKEGTTLQEIIDDGWSRGFLLDQTLREATAQGYEITSEYLRRAWDLWDQKMMEDMCREHNA